MSSGTRKLLTGSGLYVTQDSPLYVAPSRAGHDAFGRARVSPPETLFDSKLLYDKAPLLYDEVITNSSTNATSTHSTTDARVQMHVEDNDDITRQTFARFNYQPGKSQLTFLTFVLDSGTNSTNVTRKVGLYDGDDGVYLIDVNGVLSFAVEKNSSRTTIAQSAWNLDTMDGNGPSGITLDRTKAWILVIDFEWLGVGTVRFGFVVDGQVLYAHEQHHANSAASVYMSTPNLPVHYSIDSTGLGTDASMDQICSTVISEGGRQEVGSTFGVSTGTTHVDANTVGTWYALVGIRPKSTHLDSVVSVLTIDLLCLTNDDAEWALYLAPTVAGTFTYSGVTNSGIEYATGATANTITNGTVVASGYIKNNAAVRPSLPDRANLLGAAIDGTPRELVLAVNPLSINLDVLGAITYQEST